MNDIRTSIDTACLFCFAYSRQFGNVSLSWTQYSLIRHSTHTFKNTPHNEALSLKKERKKNLSCIEVNTIYKDGWNTCKNEVTRRVLKTVKSGSYKMNRKHNVKILPWQHQKPFIIRCSDDTHE